MEKKERRWNDLAWLCLTCFSKQLCLQHVHEQLPEGFFLCVCCCWCFFNVHSGQTSFYGGLTNFLPHLFRMNTLLGTYVPVRDACPLSRLSVTRAGCRRIRETFLYYFVYTRYIGSCVLFSVSLHRLKWVVWSFSCQFTRATRTAAEKKSAKRFGTIWFAQFTLVRVFFCLSVYTSYSG